MKKITIVSFLLAGAVIAIVPAVQGQGIGTRKLDEMLIPSKSRLERGKKIYAKNCASCHGEGGAGNATVAASFEGGIPDLTKAEYRHGGGPIQSYNVITKGVGGHAKFNHLAYQDRWAATHFVRSVGPTSNLKDPQAVIDEAVFEALNGVCDENVKAGISEKVKPTGEEQLATAKKVYEQQCASCHGNDGKGDGAAGASLNPKPRNFVDGGEKWTNGTSELAIFNTLAVGIEGTGMAAFAQIPEEERWALVHYLRQWIPEDKKETSTPQQIDAVCRSISTPPKPDAISIEAAMGFMIADAPAKRATRVRTYGTAFLTDGANKVRGKAVYQTQCASCHGVEGVGNKQLGPYGAFPPYLFVKVERLTPASVGGTYEQFASRVTGGPHTTLPDMTAVGQLAKTDWQAVQAYIAQEFSGDGQFKFESERVAPVVEGEPTEEKPEEPTGNTPANDGDNNTPPPAQ